MIRHDTLELGLKDSGAPGTCLLCHTVDASVTQLDLENGAYWRCRRCGQMWDAARLSAAAAYSLTVSREQAAVTP